MNEDDVIREMIDFLNSKFPKTCSCCGKRYGSLEEYLRQTTHTGKPISYDADDESWRPVKPIGTLSLANCSCGSTLAINSKGMNLITLWKMMNWARKESKRRGIRISDLLEDLRSKIDKRVLKKDRD